MADLLTNIDGIQQMISEGGFEMKVTLNGQRIEVKAEENTNIDDLLNQLMIHKERIAIAVNGEIVNRKLYATKSINSGDKIEVVQLMAGG